MSDEHQPIDAPTDATPAVNAQPQGAPDAQAAEYLAGWKRALADYENAKRETAHARRDGANGGKMEAVEAFLPALDALDAAVKFAPDLSTCDEVARKSLESWTAGVKHVQALYASSLESLGVSRVPTVGLVDPHRHESVGDRESGEPAGTILEVVAPGYLLGDRLIRPARVIVSSGTPPSP
jgi:molecular chaperone GrpE